MPFVMLKMSRECTFRDEKSTGAIPLAHPLAHFGRLKGWCDTVIRDEVAEPQRDKTTAKAESSADLPSR